MPVRKSSLDSCVSSSPDSQLNSSNDADIDKIKNGMSIEFSTLEQQFYFCPMISYLPRLYHTPFDHSEPNQIKFYQTRAYSDTTMLFRQLFLRVQIYRMMVRS